MKWIDGSKMGDGRARLILAVAAVAVLLFLVFTVLDVYADGPSGRGSILIRGSCANGSGGWQEIDLDLSGLNNVYLYRVEVSAVDGSLTGLRIGNKMNHGQGAAIVYGRGITVTSSTYVAVSGTNGVSLCWYADLENWSTVDDWVASGLPEISRGLYTVSQISFAVLVFFGGIMTLGVAMIVGAR